MIVTTDGRPSSAAGVADIVRVLIQVQHSIRESAHKMRGRTAAAAAEEEEEEVQELMNTTAHV